MNKKGIGAVIVIAVIAGLIGGTSMNVAQANHGGTVEACTGATPLFDPVSGNCVESCPNGIDDSTRTPHCLIIPPEPPAKVNTICPQENVQHWDKIIFKVKLKGNENKIFAPFDPEVRPAELLVGLTYDVKVLDDPAVVAELEAKVSSKLNEIGYQVEKKSGQNTINQFIARSNIEIIDVEYAIACISNAVDPDPPGEL